MHYFLAADLADDSRSNWASGLIEATLSFWHSNSSNAIIPGKLAVTVRILRVVFIQQSVVWDDVDGTLLVAHLPHLSVLALNLRQFNLIAILVVNSWFHWRLLIIVALHVTVGLIMSRNINNWWALCQFSTDLISPGLFFLFKGWSPIDLLIVDIGITASFRSGFRDGSVTVSPQLIWWQVIVWTHALATSRNVRPTVILPRESFFLATSYNIVKTVW